MEIKPIYVTFEQAKLFKEKGFDEITKAIYQYENLEVNNDYVNFRNSLFSYDHFEISAPEHWQVVEWLRVNYGIWVSIEPCMNVEGDWRTPVKGTFSFMYAIKYANEKLYIVFNKNPMLFEKGFKTPQEAYSAAFDYILNNII